MADKTINDLTAATTLASGDLFEIENTGNNSRKITASDAAKSLRGFAFSGAKVRKSANLTAQNLTSGATVTFNNEDYDTDGYHDTGSNTDRLTMAEAGYYRFDALLEIANTGTGNYCRILIERYNSSNVLQEYVAIQMMEASVTGTFHFTANGVTKASAGDYAVMRASVESDTSVDITTTTSFAIERVG